MLTLNRAISSRNATFMYQSIGKKMRVLLLSLLLVPAAAFAKSPIYTSFFSDVAVSGYDTVAFFTEQKPVKGNSDFSTEYKGAQWHFKNEENLKLFISSPEKYAPQYGGYCAWAVAQDVTAKGDPKYWAIEKGKLYLNYDQHVQSKWLADKNALIQSADANWPNVLK